MKNTLLTILELPVTWPDVAMLALVLTFFSFVVWRVTRN